MPRALFVEVLRRIGRLRPRRPKSRHENAHLSVTATP